VDPNVRELALLSAIACVALGLAWIYEADFFAIWRWRPRDIGETPEPLQVLTNTIYRFKPIGLARTAVAAALQRSRRSGLSGDLR
jgi:hypothetical protein